MKPFFVTFLSIALFLLGGLASSAQDINENGGVSINMTDGNQIEYSRGAFFSNGRELSRSELQSILAQDVFNTCLSAQRQYIVGKRLINAGAIVMGVGATSLAAGVVLYSCNYDDFWTFLENSIIADYCLLGAIIGGGVGFTILSVGIPLHSIGGSRLGWVAEDYNLHPKESASLLFGLQKNGIGFSINF